jgi:cell division protein FtsB
MGLSFMVSQEKEFEDLLSEMAERRRRAYRRATIYTIIPVVVGALWLLFSVYQVYRLNQQKSLVEQQIQAAIDELNRKQNEMASVTTALADKTQQLKDAEAALTKINTGVANPKEVSKEALQNINKATQAEVVPPSRPTPTPARSPTTGTARMGFNGTNYTGRDKTVITIEVTPENTRLSVTYNLDGKAVVVRDNSFSFTLDKSQHDPTRLIMFFDFFSENKDGVYKVKITARDGSVLNLIIKEPSTQTITRAFIFDIV